MKKLLALVAIFAMVLSLVACGGNTSTSNAGTDTSNNSNNQQDDQGTESFKVGFVCPEATNEGWQVTAAAIEDTAKDLDIEISKLYLDPSDYEGSFALAVDTFIQQKVDAIIYGGADESYAASVHKAQDEGIKCVEIDNPTNAGNLWHIAVDSYAAAAVAGEWMAEELESGVVLVINGDMARTMHSSAMMVLLIQSKSRVMTLKFMRFTPTGIPQLLFPVLRMPLLGMGTKL